MTGYRESYRPGSFRGAAFVTSDSDLGGGRRVALHEYPERDLPWAQDLGRRARTYSLECFMIGADYFGPRDALIKALEEPGAGLLIHPFHGEHNLAVEDYRCQESTVDGGIARFSITFVEAGAAQAGESLVDPAINAKAIADDMAELETGAFEADFSVAGLPGFSVDGAIKGIAAFSDSIENAGRLLGGAGKALRAFESGIALLDAASSLVTTPVTLARTIRTMVRHVRALGSVPLLRVRALRRLIDDGSAQQRPIGMTPVRVRERANADALSRLIVVSAVAEAVGETTAINFPSRDEALAFRDSFAAQIDAAIIEAADAGADAHAERLDALRLAMVRDVTARGTRLDPLQSFTPIETEPALVIVHRLYGAVDMDARMQALVARNAIIHPGFVAGGQPLSVLIPANATGGGGNG